MTFFLDHSVNVKMLNVITISVQNDESLHGHCTNERRAGKRDGKVRRDVI